MRGTFLVSIARVVTRHLPLGMAGYSDRSTDQVRGVFHYRERHDKSPKRSVEIVWQVIHCPPRVGANGSHPEWAGFTVEGGARPFQEHNDAEHTRCGGLGCGVSHYQERQSRSTQPYFNSTLRRVRVPHDRGRLRPKHNTTIDCGVSITRSGRR